MARPLAMALFVLLAATSVQSVGIVGEVDATWALALPPRVWVSTDPAVFADPTRSPHAAHRIGTTAVGLEASQVRPVENLVLGGARIPLSVNRYTGGLPDLPSRILYGLTGSLTAVRALHVGYGLLLLGFVGRILRLGSAPVAAGAATLWLAADFNFLFYRKVLGGTEVWLLFASLLLVRAVWDRRWRGGGMAPWGLGLAIGMGLHAKSTFVVPLAVAAVVTLVTRFDRRPGTRLVPIPARRWAAGAALAVAGLVPGLLTGLHHGWVPEAPHIFSHDFPDMQWARLWQGWAAMLDGSFVPAREGTSNWLSFWLGPLRFFTAAYGTDPVAFPSLGRTLGWGLVGLGTALAWKDLRIDRTARTAMLRWLSLAVPLASLGLFLLNRDAHHQAMLTGWSALWAGLALTQLASRRAPPRSPKRALWAGVLLLPWLASGIHEARSFDGLLSTSGVHQFREDGQAELTALVRSQHVTHLVTCDYDLYGMLEVRLPEVTVDNAWGAMSQGKRDTVLSQLLSLASGGHYLTIRQDTKRLYDIDPSERRLRRAAAEAGVQVELVASLRDAEGPWARLYQVVPAQAP